MNSAPGPAVPKTATTCGLELYYTPIAGLLK